MLRLDQTITYHIRILAKKYHQWAKRNFSEDHEEPTPPPPSSFTMQYFPFFCLRPVIRIYRNHNQYYIKILLSNTSITINLSRFLYFPLLIIKRMFILATSPRALTLLWMSKYKMMLSMSRFIKHFLKPYVYFFISNLHSFVKLNYFQLRWRKENWV